MAKLVKCLVFRAALLALFFLATDVLAETGSGAESGKAAEQEGAAEDGARAAPSPDGPARQGSSRQKAPNKKKKGASSDSAKARSADETPNNDERGAQADPAGEPIDAEAYGVRLRDLERRIEALKEKIRRSHSRLSLLSEHIVSGVDGGGRAEILFENELSGAWRIAELTILLDGAVQYQETDKTGALSAQKIIPIFSGSLGEGKHVLRVKMKLRGHGFGLFSYLRGLDATVTNDYSFSLTKGKATNIRIAAWEQGGPTTSAEKRPSIRFNEKSSGGPEPRKRKAKEPDDSPKESDE